ncbi:MAG: hypothetical protein WAP57_08485 [Aquabacterium commune]|uniref:hypothetical protein n=1 Tax=Aquabacterium commune TaxID=70586 RepID=UPI003BB13544
MDAEKHTLLDGKLHVYRRKNSGRWQCSTYLGGRNHRATTGEDALALACDFAREWYMQRYVEERQRRRDATAAQLDGAVQSINRPDPASDRRRRRTPSGPTFGQACEAFLADYNISTNGERSAIYVKQKGDQIRMHLLPFFGEDRPIGEVTSGLIQEYRVHRLTSRKHAKTGEVIRPSRSTMHSESVTLRQVLKTANRKNWISALPDMSTAYRGSGKIVHRAWFSPVEYKLLYEGTRERAKNPKSERWREECEQLHDFVLFMGNTGLRPDEALRLEARDITVVKDEATGERILEIEVRGKRGVGYCKSMPGAVHPYLRVKGRKNLQPTDKPFPTIQRELFGAILKELNLKFDREGHVRTTYSLRHTYICLRLMEGADIYQVAKNCRTSVEMIEKYYASHIKNMLDASAINVRKPKPSARRVRGKAEGDTSTASI